MDVETLTREFQRQLPLYEHLTGEALFILERALGQTSIKLHSISSRIKRLDSFLDKARRKELKNPIEETHDIVGIRVVCLFMSDIALIGQAIRESFLIHGEDDKVEATEASSFGYMSVHFIAGMKEEFVGPRYDEIAKIPFEIQVRTLAMDAWANVSHYLDYKSEEDVPSELRRDFYALSGLFYVADKHFEMFYSSRKQSQKKMTELFEGASPNAVAKQEINLDSLAAYLRVRFPDREPMDADYLSMLISGLLQAGYKTIGDIERILDRAWDAFLLYENDCPPAQGKFAGAVAVSIAARMCSEKYLRIWAEQVYIHQVRITRAVAEENELYEEYRKFIKNLDA